MKLSVGHAAKATAILALIAALQTFAVPALAESGWVLEEQKVYRKEVNDLSGYNIFLDIQVSGSSITQTLKFQSPPGKFSYSGGMNCTGTWSPPPAILRPGEKIRITFHAETTGSDSRGGYHAGHGCDVSAGQQFLDEKGKVTSGGSSGLEWCRTAIGGGQTTSDSCDTSSEWPVPDGMPGQGLVFMPTVGGPAGIGAWGYRYVFKEEASAPKVSEQAPAPQQTPEKTPANEPPTMIQQIVKIDYCESTISKVRPWMKRLRGEIDRDREVIKAWMEQPRDDNWLKSFFSFVLDPPEMTNPHPGPVLSRVNQNIGELMFYGQLYDGCMETIENRKKWIESSGVDLENFRQEHAFEISAARDIFAIAKAKSMKAWCDDSWQWAERYKRSFSGNPMDYRTGTKANKLIGHASACKQWLANMSSVDWMFQ